MFKSKIFFRNLTVKPKQTIITEANETKEEEQKQGDSKWAEIDARIAASRKAKADALAKLRTPPETPEQKKARFEREKVEREAARAQNDLRLKQQPVSTATSELTTEPELSTSNIGPQPNPSKNIKKPLRPDALEMEQKPESGVVASTFSSKFNIDKWKTRNLDATEAAEILLKWNKKPELFSEIAKHNRQISDLNLKIRKRKQEILMFTHRRRQVENNPEALESVDNTLAQLQNDLEQNLNTLSSLEKNKIEFPKEEFKEEVDATLEKARIIFTTQESTAKIKQAIDSLFGDIIFNDYADIQLFFHSDEFQNLSPDNKQLLEDASLALSTAFQQFYNEYKPLQDQVNRLNTGTVSTPNVERETEEKNLEAKFKEQSLKHSLAIKKQEDDEDFRIASYSHGLKNIVNFVQARENRIGELVLHHLQKILPTIVTPDAIELFGSILDQIKKVNPNIKSEFELESVLSNKKDSNNKIYNDFYDGWAKLQRKTYGKDGTSLKNPVGFLWFLFSIKAYKLSSKKLGEIVVFAKNENDARRIVADTSAGIDWKDFSNTKCDEIKFTSEKDKLSQFMNRSEDQILSDVLKSKWFETTRVKLTQNDSEIMKLDSELYDNREVIRDWQKSILGQAGQQTIEDIEKVMYSRGDTFDDLGRPRLKRVTVSDLENIPGTQEYLNKVTNNLEESDQLFDKIYRIKKQIKALDLTEVVARRQLKKNLEKELVTLGRVFLPILQGIFQTIQSKYTLPAGMNLFFKLSKELIAALKDYDGNQHPNVQEYISDRINQKAETLLASSSYQTRGIPIIPVTSNDLKQLLTMLGDCVDIVNVKRTYGRQVVDQENFEDFNTEIDKLGPDDAELKKKLKLRKKAVWALRPSTYYQKEAILKDTNLSGNPASIAKKVAELAKIYRNMVSTSDHEGKSQIWKNQKDAIGKLFLGTSNLLNLVTSMNLASSDEAGLNPTREDLINMLIGKYKDEYLVTEPDKETYVSQQIVKTVRDFVNALMDRDYVAARRCFIDTTADSRKEKSRKAVLPFSFEEILLDVTKELYSEFEGDIQEAENATTPTKLDVSSDESESTLANNKKTIEVEIFKVEKSLSDLQKQQNSSQEIKNQIQQKKEELSMLRSKLRNIDQLIHKGLTSKLSKRSKANGYGMSTARLKDMLQTSLVQALLGGALSSNPWITQPSGRGQFTSAERSLGRMSNAHEGVEGSLADRGPGVQKSKKKTEFLLGKKIDDLAAAEEMEKDSFTAHKTVEIPNDIRKLLRIFPNAKQYFRTIAHTVYGNDPTIAEELKSVAYEAIIKSVNDYVYLMQEGYFGEKKHPEDIHGYLYRAIDNNIKKALVSAHRVQKWGNTSFTHGLMSDIWNRISTFLNFKNISISDINSPDQFVKNIIENDVLGPEIKRIVYEKMSKYLKTKVINSSPDEREKEREDLRLAIDKTKELLNHAQSIKDTLAVNQFNQLLTKLQKRQRKAHWTADQFEKGTETLVQAFLKELPRFIEFDRTAKLLNKVANKSEQLSLSEILVDDEDFNDKIGTALIGIQKFLLHKTFRPIVSNETRQSEVKTNLSKILSDYDEIVNRHKYILQARRKAIASGASENNLSNLSLQLDDISTQLTKITKQINSVYNSSFHGDKKTTDKDMIRNNAPFQSATAETGPGPEEQLSIEQKVQKLRQKLDQFNNQQIKTMDSSEQEELSDANLLLEEMRNAIEDTIIRVRRQTKKFSQKIGDKKFYAPSTFNMESLLKLFKVRLKEGNFTAATRQILSMKLFEFYYVYYKILGDFISRLSDVNNVTKIAEVIDGLMKDGILRFEDDPKIFAKQILNFKNSAILRDHGLQDLSPELIKQFISYMQGGLDTRTVEPTVGFGGEKGEMVAATSGMSDASNNIDDVSDIMSDIDKSNEEKSRNISPEDRQTIFNLIQQKESEKDPNKIAEIDRQINRLSNFSAATNTASQIVPQQTVSNKPENQLEIDRLKTQKQSETDPNKIAEIDRQIDRLVKLGAAGYTSLQMPTVGQATSKNVSVPNAEEIKQENIFQRKGFKNLGFLSVKDVIGEFLSRVRRGEETLQGAISSKGSEERIRQREKEEDFFGEDPSVILRKETRLWADLIGQLQDLTNIQIEKQDSKSYIRDAKNLSSKLKDHDSIKVGAKLSEDDRKNILNYLNSIITIQPDVKLSSEQIVQKIKVRLNKVYDLLKQSNLTTIDEEPSNIKFKERPKPEETKFYNQQEKPKTVEPPKPPESTPSKKLSVDDMLAALMRGENLDDLKKESFSPNPLFSQLHSLVQQFNNGTQPVGTIKHGSSTLKKWFPSQYRFIVSKINSIKDTKNKSKISISGYDVYTVSDSIIFTKEDKTEPGEFFVWFVPKSSLMI